MKHLLTAFAALAIIGCTDNNESTDIMSVETSDREIITKIGNEAELVDITISDGSTSKAAFTPVNYTEGPLNWVAGSTYTIHPDGSFLIQHGIGPGSGSYSGWHAGPVGQSLSPVGNTIAGQHLRVNGPDAQKLTWLDKGYLILGNNNFTLQPPIGVSQKSTLVVTYPFDIDINEVVNDRWNPSPDIITLPANYVTHYAGETYNITLTPNDGMLQAWGVDFSWKNVRLSQGIQINFGSMNNVIATESWTIRIEVSNGDVSETVFSDY